MPPVIKIGFSLEIWARDLRLVAPDISGLRY